MYKAIYITNKTEEEESKIYLWDDIEGLQILDYADFNYAYKASVTGDKVSIHGNKLSKIFNYNYNDNSLFESDVPKETRVLTDLYQSSGDLSKDVFTLIFDIEVSSEGGFATPEKATNEITAIANYWAPTDTYTVFLLDKSGKMEYKKTGNEEIFPFKTEEELLYAWLEYYTKLKPSILSHWNGDYYDIPYLYNRLKIVFDTDTANMLSPVGLIKYNNFKQKYVIAGVSSLDYMRMYQKFTFIRKPNYRLDSIGRSEVKMGKVEYEGSLDMLYRDDIQKFIEYNLQDVKIIVALDKKLQMIQLARTICHTGRVPYEEYATPSRYIEGAVLVYLHELGIIASNRVEGYKEAMHAHYDDDEEGITGAYVQDPVAGLHRWVYSLDLQSLYPSIIMSLNISPECKIGFVKNYNIEDHNKGRITSYLVESMSGEINQLNHVDFIEFMESGKMTISSNGILFDTEKRGIIPSILFDWFEKRAEYKNLMKKYKREGNEELTNYYDKLQHTQKILLNSVYGVLALPSFRFYDTDNAEAVTLSGQDIIKTTSKLINKKYNELLNETEENCIYIDTDAVYFSAVKLFDKYNTDNRELTDDMCKELTIKIAYENEKYLNDIYPAMAQKLFYCNNSRLKIKGEAVAKSALWIRKKRYALDKVYDLEAGVDVTGDDRFYVKGLDVVRSSFPAAFQGFMKQVLLDILAIKPKEYIDEELLKFKKASMELEFEEIAKNTSVKEVSKYDNKKEKSFVIFVSKTPAHIKSALCYNRFLKYYKLDKIYQPIRDGDKIKWIYLRENSLGIEQMALKGYDDPKELTEFVMTYMSREEMYKHELKKKIQNFYDVLDWGLISTEVNQKARKFLSFKTTVDK